MRQSKYHAKKATNKYGTFDSLKEYKRFLELKKLEDEGKIEGLERQVPFELVPKLSLKVPRTKNGRSQRTEIAVKYVADFTYYVNGLYVVEDVKGMRTSEYIIKRKLMLWVHNIQIKEV